MTKHYIKYKRGFCGLSAGFWTYEEGCPGHVLRLRGTARLREAATKAGGLSGGGSNLL